MTLADSIQLFVPTSVCPWHPSTHVIEQTITSVWEMLREEVPPTIYCDMPPSWTPPEQCYDYEEYLRQLKRIGIGKLVLAPKWVGLVGLFKLLWDNLDKPLVLNVQHDWEFINSNRVDPNQLVARMVADERLQVIRFSKRSLPYNNYRWRMVDHRTEEVDPDRFGIPLIATGGWGDSPHFARADHYTRISRIVDYNCGADGRYGVEGPIYKHYRRSMKRRGFIKAQRDWGSFLYGQYHEEAYIQHLGAGSKRWRKQLGIPAKRG